MLKRLLTLATDKIYTLPIIVLMPHSRCNCRCVMCDIWKANYDKKEISPEELQKHVGDFVSLGVREVVLSGGEALMHSNLWNLCAILRENGIRITLLSTGLMLERNAQEIVENMAEVIVSLDGSQSVHDSIRNIPQGFEKLRAGVRALKRRSPAFRVTARCVLQRHNFADFLNTVSAAKEIGLDQISFLAADISSTAFNHTANEIVERVNEVALNRKETREFGEIIENSFSVLSGEYDSKFIAESRQKMRKILQYYEAVNGLAEFTAPVCNAPWVSAVIESDGKVMPCFFHAPYGNIYDSDFLDIINSDLAIEFRKKLNVKEDPVCRKCVCSLKLGINQ